MAPRPGRPPGRPGSPDRRRIDYPSIMIEPFTRRFLVRWGDVDFNGHMRNTAYLDVSSDVRMLCFAEGGFPMREFERLRVGPVVFKDEVEYLRELRLLEPFKVTLALAGLSQDGARFRLRNAFADESGRPVARVTSTGGWLNLDARRLLPPPEPVARVLAGLTRTEDYAVLEGGGRS